MQKQQNVLLVEGRKISHLPCLLFIQKNFTELLENTMAVPQKKLNMDYHMT